MAAIDHSVYPGGGFGRGMRYMIDASVIAGGFGMRNSNVSTAGEVIDATATSAVALLGIYDETVTYSATQSAYDGFPSDEEGTVLIESDPFAIYKLRTAGSATAGAALATTAPANILVNETADTTGLIITDDVVGTVSFNGGLIAGRTGNNAGIVRRISAHNNSADTRVEVPFPRTIAVGDTFIRVPWGKATQTVQLVTLLTEANGIIVYGTGAEFIPVDVQFDIIRDEVMLYMLPRAHAYKPLA